MKPRCWVIWTAAVFLITLIPARLLFGRIPVVMDSIPFDRWFVLLLRPFGSSLGHLLSLVAGRLFLLAL